MMAHQSCSQDRLFYSFNLEDLFPANHLLRGIDGHPPRLEDEISDPSSFSKNRHGGFRESDAFRKPFESLAWRCMTEELIGGEGFAADAKPAVERVRR